MSKHTKAEIGAILDDELRLHRAAYIRAKKLFDTLIGDPSSIPHPDGTLHVKNVGSAHVFALRADTTALRERGRFVTHGEIPAASRSNCTYNMV